MVAGGAASASGTELSTSAGDGLSSNAPHGQASPSSAGTRALAGSKDVEFTVGNGGGGGGKDAGVSGRAGNNKDVSSLPPDSTVLTLPVDDLNGGGGGAGNAANGSGGANGGASSSSSPSKKKPKPPLAARVKAFCIAQFMPLSFLVAAALALAWPLPGRVVLSWQAGDVRIVQAINNAIVFLISGLTLKSGALWRSGGCVFGAG